MKAAVVREPGKVEVAQVPIPVPDDYQALAKTRACAICNGTDSKILNHTLPFVEEREYPLILGHESVGQVVKAGKKCRRFREGDWVFEPMAPALGGFGSAWGGFAEYGLLDDLRSKAKDGIVVENIEAKDYQEPIPAGVDPLLATVLIPLRETLSVLMQAGVGKNDTLLVLGTGPAALAFIENAKLLGARRVYVLGRREECLRRARDFGADEVIQLGRDTPGSVIRSSNPEGVDFIVDATGAREAIEAAVRCLRKGGKFIPYGVFHKGDEVVLASVPGRFDVPVREWFAQENVTRFVKEGKLDPKRYISEVISLRHISEAFAKIRERKVVKVVVDLEMN